MGGGIRLGADATSRRAESMCERGLEGQVSSTRYRCSLWRWMVWGLDAERWLLGWKCLWDIQGTCSETIVLEELVSVNGMGVIP